MAKTRRNWASKTEALSERQAERLRRFAVRDGSEPMLRWFRDCIEGKTGLKPEAEGFVSRHQAFAFGEILEKRLGKLPKAARKASPKAKKAEAPKPKASDAFSLAVAEATKVAEATESRIFTDGQPLKGWAVIRFKGNTALGKAYHTHSGSYEWKIDPASQSYDKAKAFAEAFCASVGKSVAEVEALRPLV